MRPLETREQALHLVALGINDCEIARRLGIPRTTVRDWRKPRYVPKRAAPGPCPRCWRPGPPVVLDDGDYAELLGLYLGDGCISAGPRTERLRIFLDSKYAEIVDESAALLQRVFPENRVGRGTRHHGRMTVLSVYSRHLSCLLPQHGSGKKHERPIVLEPWQEAHSSAAPWRLLRGLIWTDGCVFVNRTGRYEYLSYAFCNISQDILELFERTCLDLGLRPRRTRRDIRINRREDVARMLEHVGPKR